MPLPNLSVLTCLLLSGLDLSIAYFMALRYLLTLSLIRCIVDFVSFENSCRRTFVLQCLSGVLWSGNGCMAYGCLVMMGERVGFV